MIRFPGKIDREAEEHPAEEERLPARKLKAPKDLFCSVCLCIFQTPVMLQCGHSFCRSCVLQTWAGKLSRKCPLCEQVSAEGPPQVNFSLKSLSESFLETHAEPAAARRDDSPRVIPHDAAAAARCLTTTALTQKSHYWTLLKSHYFSKQPP